MPAKPPARCHRTYRCDCRKNTVRKSAAVTWSLKRLRAIAPKAPPCPWCGAPMKRAGTSYQGLIDPSWDTEAGRTRVRAMFAAMVGR